MTEVAIDTSAASAELVSLPAGKTGVRRWLAPALSLLILGAALWQLRGLNVRELVGMVPRSPLFWLVYGLSYLSLPVSEWVIYRRFWKLPPSGIVALLRKRVSNELVLGYSGELYFYAWARQHARVSGSPFGLIKDVAILSALTANAVTLLLLAANWQRMTALNIGISNRVLTGSLLVIVVPSLFALVWRKRVFTLRRRDLANVAGIHLVRIAATTLLTAAQWALIMPQGPIVWWVVLATMRLIVSRLPLLPAKDVVLAGLIAFAVGRPTEVSAMLAMLAGLNLFTHIILGALTMMDAAPAEQVR